MGAHDKRIECKTRDVALGIGSSQQTASRRLIEMEKAGLIQRSWDGRTQKVQITKEGLQQLAGMHRVLKSAFEAELWSGEVLQGHSKRESGVSDRPSHPCALW